MSFWEKLFGKKKKKVSEKPELKEVSKVEKPVVEEPVAEPPVAEEPEKEVPKEAKVQVKKEELPNEQPDLSSKTVAELKEMAKAEGITGYSSMRKAELIEVLSK